MIGRGLYSRSSGLSIYFALAFLISWSCWLPAALSGEDTGAVTIQMLVYAGILGPPVATIAVLYFVEDQAYRADFWERLYSSEFLRLPWLAAIILVYPLLTALGVSFDWALTGRSPDASVLLQLLSHPAVLLAYLILTLLLGPFPEELGWRGYALDRLKPHRAPLTASLLVGGAWASWHLPLFFVTGTYQNGLGFLSSAFWLFNLTAIASSLVFTLVYNRNRRSILSAILLHGAINFTRFSVVLSERADVARTVLLIALATGIAVSWSRPQVSLGTRRC